MTRRLYRPEVTVCLTCQTPLQRYTTLSQRTVITLDGPVRLIYRGYRCPNTTCTTQTRCYRSAAADALALPGCPFGLDLVILVGHLRLSQHHTLDEVRQILSMRLQPFALTENGPESPGLSKPGMNGRSLFWVGVKAGRPSCALWG